MAEVCYADPVRAAPARVLLFDIDGTLLNAGGIGRRAFTAALAGVGADRAVLDGIRFAGTTDRAIARAALEGAGVAADAPLVQRVLTAYVEVLAAELAARRDGECRLCPGVAELLERLAGAPLLLGLGTGNVEAGARLKLEAVGIAGHFRFGGFGDEHEERAEVLRLAAARGAALAAGRATEVIVIGDTPRDVQAARAIGARVLAVTTGPFDHATLSGAGPDWLVDDLRAPEVLGLLTGVIAGR